jgi:hypothetical protein
VNLVSASAYESESLFKAQEWKFQEAVREYCQTDADTERSEHLQKRKDEPIVMLAQYVEESYGKVVKHVKTIGDLA